MEETYFKLFLVGLCYFKRRQRVNTSKMSQYSISHSKQIKIENQKSIRKAQPPPSKKKVKARDWLNADSETFRALQNIITDENTSKDMKYLTNFFSHTGILLIFHGLYNKCFPIRSQLTIMDFKKKAVNYSRQLQRKTRKDKTFVFPEKLRVGHQSSSKGKR